MSGPSGVGKGTIVKKLLNCGGFALSVSCTTRAPREREKNGKDYFFLSKTQFEQGISRGEFLEYNNHFGNFYGTPRPFVEKKLKTADVILEIEVDGALQVKKSYSQAVLIMIAPPNRDELIKRLRGRGTESEEKICERLARTDYEMSKSGSYDYTVVNDDLNRAVEEIKSIIKKEKEKNDKPTSR